MNIFQREANDIVNYLQRHGYEAHVDQAKSQVVVMDAVMVLGTTESAKRTEHNEVRFNGWDFAIRFVEVRS